MRLFRNNVSGSIPSDTVKFGARSKLAYDDLVPGFAGLCSPPSHKSCALGFPSSLVSLDSPESDGWLLLSAFWTGFILGYFILGLMILFSGKVRHRCLDFCQREEHLSQKGGLLMGTTLPRDVTVFNLCLCLLKQLVG
ncbi:hypothetical protein R1flu_009458 [Riccia fluitans]|uniref:Uncharacterized protein n=1 Tax=Riccia fluitans TaxID=41844 RepID=A0ABD1Z265_9MARC